MKSTSALFLICILFSCEYETTSISKIYANVDYPNDIVPILNQHCSVSGCHVSGATTGDFKNYDQLKLRIDNGKFNKMVFELRLMPPATYPALSEEEIAMLESWVSAGAKRD